ncbi:NAD(P)/FAD-dependent oxidoreductase [Limnobacter litoralis]|uniref:Amine oxidase domain-containing protein n=1 Tax=Limnobacter litoralis TaxID=481366 RepID=A0ABQ5YUB3_9BURK|nr:NAD(P)/FAD-dependent oxidoreductase [Limnobacter litoralis]GLR27037.1 hypothetical protein GCM10007875_21280 [Limnobacter litoralis]
MQHTTTIAILGGGLSGLYAAHLLQLQGIPFTLFEARTRLGGRIHSTPQGFDLGPAWFWPEANPRISQLVNEFGLSWFEQHSAGAALFGFVGGSTAARNRLDNEQLKALAVEQLSQLFGPAAANPLAVHHQEWGNDALLSTADDLQGTGQHPHYARRTLPQPWAELVQLAGTENSPEAGGYLEGALESAQWAVQHIQRAIH